ncbi:MAG: DUF1016 domain-containing protein [Candidatus Nanohalarchaeota archaeon]|nr:MAG: DUF1016 domain-containing protein [Candidatus Nanohaloarchaeota archaeon]
MDSNESTSMIEQRENQKLTLSKNEYSSILNEIVVCIENAKLKAFTHVNKILLNAYWNIGNVLSENSSYGASVVEKLSQDLKMNYPATKGYSVRNLRNMKRFYEDYQKLQTLSAELLFSVSWSNHVAVFDLAQSPEEMEFYIKMAIKERRSNRELKRQINSSLFGRYMLADKPEKVIALMPKHKSKDLVRHFKDKYILEFLNLGKEHSEQELEKAIIGNLRDFFMEFSNSFAFIGSQYAIDIGGRENRIDLLFYHRELRCLVAVDLKIGEFRASYVGQMQKYLAALDEKARMADEKESIGLILCKSKNHEEVRFALAKTLSPVKVAVYKTKLPDKKLILHKLEQIMVDKELNRKNPADLFKIWTI